MRGNQKEKEKGEKCVTCFFPFFFFFEKQKLIRNSKTKRISPLRKIIRKPNLLKIIWYFNLFV